ncbi:MAG: dTDP-glucose 4,6-dehydratase [Armatimonadota bacterium]
MRVLVTGGAGFIGSHFARHLLCQYPQYRVTVLDALTYAGNLSNLADLMDNPNFAFYHGDVRDPVVVRNLVRNHDWVVNFAAETHVDRSILHPGSFLQTDVYGAYVLLEACREFGGKRFLQVSTDEVYGEVLEGFAPEEAPLRPRSPYSASKAAAELLVQAYRITYGLDVRITRGSNTYGPNQYPEKMIPLFITNALEGRPLPLYGDGSQVRDWIYVEDHCTAIDTVLHHGEPGGVYNIGAGNLLKNRTVAEKILEILGKPASLIQSVADRPGHDRRYAVDTSHLRQMGWSPRWSFEAGLEHTVQWYRTHSQWWKEIKSQKEYQQFASQWYQQRGQTAPKQGETEEN